MCNENLNRRYVISGLFAPISQAPDGIGYNPGRQEIAVPREISALAIASDSELPDAIIYLEDGAGYRTAMHVSSRRPWFGRLIAETGKLIVCPAAPAQAGKLKLEVYSGCYPPLANRRGDVTYLDGLIDAPDVTTGHTFPVRGRTLVSITVSLREPIGSPFGSSVITIYGQTSVETPGEGLGNRLVQLASEVVAVNTTRAWVYEGASWDEIVVQSNPDTGPYHLEIRVDAVEQ